MIEKYLNLESKTICLATPYLNDNKIIASELIDRLLSLKLFILFNFKWAKKENNIDDGLTKSLNRMNVNKKQLLYDII